MAAKKGSPDSTLTAFLAGLRIVRLDPVGRTSASGNSLDRAALANLLKKGDPVPPVPGIVPQTAQDIATLFEEEGPSACFPLTPDGHLASHRPIVLDPSRATEQVIALVDTTLNEEDREEALAATWLGLGYHDHDHPADFAGLLLGQHDARPRCCYLDVKLTEAHSVDDQRTKLEQRAQERKLAMMALTLTRAANNGFAGYPGRGRPGLLATVLCNPVIEGRRQAGFAVNWFFGIASNFQASAARWGWGGPRRAYLPTPLMTQLYHLKASVAGQSRSWLAILEGYRHYRQFRSEDGVWDREGLQATLQAMHLAARHLLMNEDVMAQANASITNLHPTGVEAPIDLEELHPGESFATYYGRRADAAIRRLNAAVKDLETANKIRDAVVQERDAVVQERDAVVQERDAVVQERDAVVQERDSAARERDSAARERDAAARDREEALRQLVLAVEQNRQLVERRRQRGHPDAEIAEDLNLSLDVFLQRYPRST